MEANVAPKPSLLDACLRADGCSGGTIHEYLPRLSWCRVHGQSVRRMGRTPVWSLRLGNREIGWCQCYESELPPIDPSLGDSDWVILNRV